MIEWFGTAMSVIVAISLTQRNIKRLRIINLIGAAGFAVYGAVIQAWPVLGLNAFITVTDVYYLIQMARKKDHFDLVTVDPGTDSYTRYFVDFYNEDINTFIPDFSIDKLKDARGCFVLREAMAASLFLYRQKDENTIEILLDYAVPQYRDYSNALYFFNAALSKLGIRPDTTFECIARTAAHIQYLKKMGFQLVETVGNAQVFSKTV